MSILFWLVILPAFAIIFIGIRFIVSPLAGATGFGVPAGASDTTAYLWAKGVRDIVSGLFPIVLLYRKAPVHTISTYLFVIALVPLSDLVNVYLHVGVTKIGALMIHGGTALYLVTVAGVLHNKGGGSSAASGEAI